MQQNLAKFFEWTQQCFTQKACLDELSRLLPGKRIHLPEVQSRQVLAAEAP